MDGRTNDSNAVRPAWVHAWAVFTVCATFGLLALGAVVTTFHVGMADPIWPTYPWHLLLISWEEPRAGFIVEHSHRLAGYIVGVCAIVLAVGLWRTRLRWLGVAALAGVIVQGLLGGFRVRLNELLGPNLALVHGSFATVVFSMLVAIAWLTKRIEPDEARATLPSSHRFRGLTIHMVAVVMAQIIMGGFVRHTYSPLGQRGHLIAAFGVVALVCAFFYKLRSELAPPPRLNRVASVLVGLVGIQVVLGVEAWMQKYFGASTPISQAVVRTAHVLMGSLILATAVVCTLETFRLTQARIRSATRSTRQLEHVA
jgi:cytochrome c oxidase assembly protein subunit 15